MLRGALRIVLVAASASLAFATPGAQAPLPMAELIAQYADWVNGRRASGRSRRRRSRRRPPRAGADGSSRRFPSIRVDAGPGARDAAPAPHVLRAGARGGRLDAARRRRRRGWSSGRAPTSATHTPHQRLRSRLAARRALGARGGHRLARACTITWRTRSRSFPTSRGWCWRAASPRSSSARRPRCSSAVETRGRPAARARGAGARRGRTLPRVGARHRAVPGSRDATTSVAGEALLRAGHVELRLGRYDEALATWNGARAADRRIRRCVYLLHLFRGIAYEGPRPRRRGARLVRGGAGDQPGRALRDAAPRRARVPLRPRRRPGRADRRAAARRRSAARSVVVVLRRRLALLVSAHRRACARC